MPDGELELIDLDSTMEDDDPKGEKPNEDKTNGKMDIDGGKEGITCLTMMLVISYQPLVLLLMLHSNKQKGLIQCPLRESQ